MLFDLLHLVGILVWRKWSGGNCIIDQPFYFLCSYLPLREELYLSDVHLQAFLRLRFLPGHRLRLQQLSKHSFSKCSKQTWHWLSLGKFALLIRTSRSLRIGLYLRPKGSRWKLIPLLESLGVLFEQPTPHIRPVCIWRCCLLEIRVSRTQWRHAMRLSLQHGFQNVGCSNCPGAEVFTVTIGLKSKFTPKTWRFDYNVSCAFVRTTF